MRVTDKDDTLSGVSDGASGRKPRLQLDVYLPIANAMGYPTVTKQAAWHELHRSAMHDLRSGKVTPKLETAMRISNDCGVPIEALWFERAAA